MAHTQARLDGARRLDCARAVGFLPCRLADDAHVHLQQRVAAVVLVCIARTPDGTRAGVRGCSLRMRQSPLSSYLDGATRYCLGEALLAPQVNAKFKFAALEQQRC